MFEMSILDQSGTKPNLVAKMWPPNLVTICAWLPKLVANVSSNFHHLVNTGLHRFSQKWELWVFKWNFRVCKMPLLMKIPMKMKELGYLVILGCAIGSFACAKHRCTGGWLKLCRARCWFFFQMATNNGSPHLQIRHNLSGLYLANWKWLHPIIITFNTLCLVKFYIQWCGALQWTRWRSYLKQLICSCLAS